MKRSVAEILFYWLIGGLIIPNLCLSFAEPISVAAGIANILMPSGIIGLIVAVSKNIGRTTWLLLPLTFIAAFQIVLISLYGTGIISVDMFLNVLTTNNGEATELLAEMWPSLIMTAMLYLVPLVLGVYCMVKHIYLSRRFLMLNRRASGCVTLAGIACVAFCYIINRGYDIRRDLYPVNVAYNIYLTHARCQQVKHYYETSSGFDYNIEPLHDKDENETYIIVIGETSRANDWEIFGYDRPTNRFLSRRNDLILADKAYSESNTTHKSVPMLLSCVDARTFDTELYKVKSLISAFKEAGFKTSFISNQLPNHSYIDFFGNEADSTIFVKLQPEHSENNTDTDLLPYIKKQLDSGFPKQLIVVHTYGSHFNYRDRYSEEDRIFLPDEFEEATAHVRDKLINAYDNSIVATDRFLNSVIEILNGYNGISGLLYTSDHGEDIFEDGIKFLHSSNTPTEYQLHVPLIIWLSPEYSQKYPEVQQSIRKNCDYFVSTSRSVCPTAMSIGGLKSTKTDATDDLTSPEYQVKDLYYLNDHNQSLLFKSVETTEDDNTTI